MDSIQLAVKKKHTDVEGGVLEKPFFLINKEPLVAFSPLERTLLECDIFLFLKARIKFVATHQKVNVNLLLVLPKIIHDNSEFESDLVKD